MANLTQSWLHFTVFLGDGANNRKNKKSKKKKKKRAHEEEVEETEESNDGLTSTGINLEDSDEDLFAKPSVGTALARVEVPPSATKHSNVPVVVFEDPLKKKKTKPQITLEMTEEKVLSAKLQLLCYRLL